MPKKNKLSTDEKLLKAMHGLFILQAAQSGMSGGDMRKVLGIAMNEVTPILKIANRAVKKRRREAEYRDRP
jgi:hypothetical protein